MNRLWCLLIVLIIWPEPALSQLPGNATLVLFPGVPTGNCNSRQLALNMSDGSLYTCAGAGLGNNGTWQLVAGAGGTAGVASFNTRTGPVVSVSGDYTVGQVTGAAPLISPDFSATGSVPLAPTAAAGTNTNQIATTAFVLGNSGGIANGTTNALAKYSGTNSLAPSSGTDDGNLLSYFGAGGIVGSKFSNGSGTGGFQLESVLAPLPPLPGAGNSSIVSGPDGFYVSNANTAYAKLGQAGGGTVAGVASFNTRTGPVVPVSGDYTVGMVSGAAPLASPTFTGAAQVATNPASNDNSQNIATTSWVTNYVTGAVLAQPIAHSQQAPVCGVNSNTATNTLTFPGPLNIVNGDTVLMYVQSNSLQSGQLTYQVTDDGNNTWSVIDSRTQGGAPNMATATLIGTSASAAKAATTITLTQNLLSGGTAVNAKFSACLATYVGVASFGTTNKSGATTGTTSTSTVNVQAGGYLFAGAGSGGGAFTVTWTPAPATGLNQIATSIGSGANSTGICESTSSTAAAISCTSSWSGTGNNQIIGVPLNPGVAVPAATNVRVNLYKLSAINDVSIGSVVQCSTAQCPDGYYRVTILGIVTTACTTGTAQVNMNYTNEVGPVTNLGLLANPMTFTANNVVYATRPFHHNGTAAINFSTTGVACTPTAGTGAANLRLTIERLQ